MHIKQIGNGPALVMLHGWSMHSAVWHQFADLLAEHFTLHLVDLPGHGQSDWQENALEISAVIQQLKQQLPETAYWLGWSLGGLIATEFASRYPKTVSKLILLSSTPCFVQKGDWQCAVEADVFEAFASNLDDDQEQTLKRFLMLQARGAKQSKITIRQLAEDLATSQPPHPQALKQGLSLLVETDCRQQLAELSCPVQMLLAERDTLVPASLAAEVAQLNADIDVHMIAGVGHAPFIAQPQQCSDLVREFIHA